QTHTHTYTHTHTHSHAHKLIHVHTYTNSQGSEVKLCEGWKRVRGETAAGEPGSTCTDVTAPQGHHCILTRTHARTHTHTHTHTQFLNELRETFFDSKL